MVEGVLQKVAAVLDRRRGVVEEPQRVARRDVAAAQQQRQRKPRRRGADRRGEEVLGIAQEVDVGLRASLERAAAALGEALEGAVGALLAEIARDRRAQIVDGDAGPKKPEARRDRSVVGADEGRRLQPLDGVHRPQQREADIGEEVEREAPQHAVGQLRQLEPQERGRLQQRDPERALLDEAGPERALEREARKEQRVAPDREADGEPGARAERRAARPEQAAEEGRRDLRHGREGEEADRGERGVARRPVIGVAEEDHDEDRDPPHAEHEAAEVGDRRGLPSAASLEPRRRSTIGMTRWFEIMIATATDSTITIAVAAESPPRKATSATWPAPSFSGSASTVMSRSISPGAKVARPASASGMTKMLMRTR